MLAVLQLRHTVVGKPRRAAPHYHVAVPKNKLLHAVAPLQPAELEGGRQTQRHGDDRVTIIALVSVLMQRQPGSR